MRDSLVMALTDQRTTSVQAVQLVSGSLYQVTQATTEISLEAQVKEQPEFHIIVRIRKLRSCKIYEKPYYTT